MEAVVAPVLPSRKAGEDSPFGAVLAQKKNKQNANWPGRSRLVGGLAQRGEGKGPRGLGRRSGVKSCYRRSAKRLGGIRHKESRISLCSPQTGLGARGKLAAISPAERFIESHTPSSSFRSKVNLD